MYTQTYSAKRKSFPKILTTIIVGIALSNLISLLKISSFVWIYELSILIAIVCAIYKILKTDCYLYTYTITDTEISIKLSVGQTEKILCAFEICDILSVTSENINTIKKTLGKALVYKCCENSNSKNSTKIVFKENQNTTGILEFKPDTKFLQILDKKTLDKFAEI